MRIFNIQRFCVDDGKGIRTTVFFRDCPLRCKWCANPESWVKEEILEKNGFSQKQMTATEILAEVLKDKVYYQNSGGGVTLSGGEPLLHINEVLELLKLLKKEDIHITIETCGNIPTKNIEKVLEFSPQFYFDIKHTNQIKIKDYTQGDSNLILKNLAFLIKKNAEVQVRIPVIPGFNFSQDDISEIFTDLSKLKVNSVILLPYHTLGKNKYTKLQLEYPWSEYPTMPQEKDLDKFYKLWENKKTFL